jgi:hypothetical protein
LIRERESSETRIAIPAKLVPYSMRERESSETRIVIPAQAGIQ